MSYSMTHNLGQIPPCEKFRLGHQNDGAGHLYNVVCRTPHGMIPGKGKQDKAWYPYGGKENLTKDFMFLQAEHGGQTQLVKSRQPPHGALAEGHQADGTYYVAVCHTNHGEIPGKAKGQYAWFPYGGKETRTENFSYVIVKQGHGYQPPKHGLHPGMKVHLKSKSHGKNLKIDQTHRVSGTGGNGEWATFMVHHRGGHHGSHHVALSLAKHPHTFLAIKNESLTFGNGGPHCTLKVIGPHPDGTISLESVPHQGQHVGILPNGDDKAPHQTGTGDHSRFYIMNAEPGRAPRNPVNQDDFEIIPSPHVPGFNPIPPVPGYNPNPYVPGYNYNPPVPGYNPRIQPSYLTPGYNPRIPGYNPHVPGYNPHVPGFNPRPNIPGFNPSPPPPQGLSAGMKLRFKSVKSGKTLRISDHGVIDGLGGTGAWATWTTFVKGPGQYAFKNDINKWMAIKQGKLVGVNHENQHEEDQYCVFLLHLNPDKTCSLESARERGSFVGIKRKGQPKLPFKCRRGKASSEFTIIHHSE